MLADDRILAPGLTIVEDDGSLNAPHTELSSGSVSGESIPVHCTVSILMVCVLNTKTCCFQQVQLCIELCRLAQVEK